MCEGHHAPLDFLESWCYDRPPVSVVLGPRGGGKSYLSAFATHWDSLSFTRHGTRILGGSLSQSEQIYAALRDFERRAPEAFAAFTKTKAVYAGTGSEVSMLAASPTSVRGPHVPTLRLDEIDEIEPDIREASLGMCMSMAEAPAMVSMTSTWHRIGGPMAELLDRGAAGEFPSWRFCAFEVLERCPPERSGRHLERCPDCPLLKWCHDVPSGQTPKAKRANGHYAIDALIQKVHAVSLRIFEADYLCRGPKADGLWFPRFDEARHVTEDAEFDPRFPVCLAVDVGVFTGAVWFQVRPVMVSIDAPPIPRVAVFADYLAEGKSAETNARGILGITATHCNGRIDRGMADPAGKARNAAVDETVLELYQRAGLYLEGWQIAGVLNGLELLESLLCPAVGPPNLLIHPRCQHTVKAFRAYRRAKRQSQWIDRPEDPQHPAEDLMDALRGGCVTVAGGPRVGIRPGGIDTPWR